MFRGRNIQKIINNTLLIKIDLCFKYLYIITMNEVDHYQLETPEAVAVALAERCRRLRLARKWKQSTLAERAGVSLASLRRFEQTGRIALRSLLRLSFVLGRLGDFDALLRLPPADSIKELEVMASGSQAQRGVK